jgi:pimeloyl-ACP methyl ester carboxylesterase
MFKNKAKHMSTQIVTSHLKSCPQTEYLYYKPNGKKINRVIVLIHGISRNAKEIINQFSKHDSATENGELLIAPIFSKQFATDYQRLGRMGKGPRADYLLMSIINEVSANLSIQSSLPIYIFGFSAGAQFAHRFAFAHPNQVKKVALASAGWYTFPDKSTHYPLGLKLHNEFNDIEFQLERILRTKYKVFIGEHDTKRKKGFNKNAQIDAQQGENRKIRAYSWVNQMNKSYKKFNINNNVSLEVLNDVDHDFIECNKKAQLIEKIYHWFNQT